LVHTVKIEKLNFYNFLGGTQFLLSIPNIKNHMKIGMLYSVLGKGVTNLQKGGKIFQKGAKGIIFQQF
jgi:hypothetical protein